MHKYIKKLRNIIMVIITKCGYYLVELKCIFIVIVVTKSLLKRKLGNCAILIFAHWLYDSK